MVSMDVRSKTEYLYTQVRLRAMQQLLAIPAGDPQAADHWIEIRKPLLNAFKDPNEKIVVIFTTLKTL